MNIILSGFYTVVNLVAFVLLLSAASDVRSQIWGFFKNVANFCVIFAPRKIFAS